MKVSNILVYRIEPFEKIGIFQEGDILSYPIDKNDTSMTLRKKELEDSFEKVRLSLFGDRPSRKSAMFVIPCDMNYVLRWADTKYGKAYANYLLLSLRLEGELFWHDADLFNDALLPLNLIPIDNLAQQYWGGLDEAYENVELVEGLFIGTATVEKIEIKTHDALL